MKDALGSGVNPWTLSLHQSSIVSEQQTIDQRLVVHILTDPWSDVHRILIWTSKDLESFNPVVSTSLEELKRKGAHIKWFSGIHEPLRVERGCGGTIPLEAFYFISSGHIMKLLMIGRGLGNRRLADQSSFILRVYNPLMWLSCVPARS
jgi:hypothetical protein